MGKKNETKRFGSLALRWLKARGGITGNRNRNRNRHRNQNPNPDPNQNLNLDPDPNQNPNLDPDPSNDLIQNMVESSEALHDGTDQSDGEEENPRLYVDIDSHANCNLCYFKVQSAVKSIEAGFLDWKWEAQNRISAAGVITSTKSEIEAKMSQLLGIETEVTIVEKLCEVSHESEVEVDVTPSSSEDLDIDNAKLPFEEDKFTLFRDNFNDRVKTSLDDNWGLLYLNTYSRIFKVIAKGKGEVNGTAFLISKDSNNTFFLSCAHVFKKIDMASAEIKLIGSNFRPLKVSMVFCSAVMDFSLLKGDNDPDVLPPDILPFDCYFGEIKFGQQVFSVSTPGFTEEDFAEKSSRADLEDLVETMWFPLSIGYVCHPWLVGMHPENQRGELMALSLTGLGSGASGAPILNADGKLVGVHLASYNGSDSSRNDDVVKIALRLTSIREELLGRIHVPPETHPPTLCQIISGIAELQNQVKFGDCRTSESSEAGAGCKGL